MTRSFKFNKNNKIELSKEQLKSLLDQAYWEGYRSGHGTTWTYTTPNWTPYYWTSSGQTTTTGSTGSAGITATNNSISNGTITLTSTETKNEI